MREVGCVGFFCRIQTENEPDKLNSATENTSRHLTDDLLIGYLLISFHIAYVFGCGVYLEKSDADMQNQT